VILLRVREGQIDALVVVIYSVVSGGGFDFGIGGASKSDMMRLGEGYCSGNADS
jgi:hypothetical protein